MCIMLLLFSSESNLNFDIFVTYHKFDIYDRIIFSMIVTTCYSELFQAPAILRWTTNEATGFLKVIYTHSSLTTITHF